MELEVFRKLIDHTQNMGSHEDLVTAALATAFDYCPEFMEQFFNKLELKEYKFKNNGEYEYTLETGSVINNFYEWIDKDADIDFKPDLVITKNEFWESNIIPKDEETILIESKVGAALRRSQREQYRKFKQIFEEKVSEKIKTILISLKNYNKKDVKEFDKLITWDKVIEISKDIYKDLQVSGRAKGIIKDLIEFIEISLIPIRESLKNGDGKFNPKKILNQIKGRTEFNTATIVNSYRVGLNEVKNSGYSKMMQQYNILDSDMMSYLLHSQKSKTYYFYCLVKGKKSIFWIERYNRNKLQNFHAIGDIDFSKRNWTAGWYNVLTEASNAMNILSK